MERPDSPLPPRSPRSPIPLPMPTPRGLSIVIPAMMSEALRRPCFLFPLKESRGVGFDG